MRFPKSIHSGCRAELPGGSRRRQPPVGRFDTGPASGAVDHIRSERAGTHDYGQCHGIPGSSCAHAVVDVLSHRQDSDHLHPRENRSALVAGRDRAAPTVRRAGSDVAPEGTGRAPKAVYTRNVLIGHDLGTASSHQGSGVTPASLPPAGQPEDARTASSGNVHLRPSGYQPPGGTSASVIQLMTLASDWPPCPYGELIADHGQALVIEMCT